MFQAIFNSLSGLFSFSQGLNTVSNNVANMNTPGFRGSDDMFRSIASQTGDGNGLGAMVDGTSIRDYEGTIQQTSNPGDLAINGMGFFILKDTEGNLFYTRAGQFKFDANGNYVDAATGMQVEGIDASGNLTDLNISSLTTLPPVATTTVNFTGNLSTNDSVKNVSGITVYDAGGTTQTLTAIFTNNTSSTPDSWLVSVTDSTGNVVGSGEIRFGTDGSPQTGYNSIALNLTSGASTQTVNLDFGQPGTFTGATEFSGSSTTLGATVADGHASSGMTSFSFDQTGTVQLKYSDGETKSGGQVALAYFADTSALKQANGSLFTTTDVAQRKLGHAGSDVFGNIEGGSLELANVDLTQEFGNMIVIQRGYQASSRVMTVADQLLQQLYSSTRNG